MGWSRRRPAGKLGDTGTPDRAPAAYLAVPPPSADAAVIFAAAESQLSEMTVESGPCVPAPGRERPLVSPHLQQYNEGPAQTAALFTALTGRSPAGALVLLEARGQGTLMRFSEEFLAAMADANRQHLRLADEDNARSDKDLLSFTAARRELDAAWVTAGRWPAGLVSTWNKLTRLGRAQEAQEKGQSLYVWYGPSVAEYAISTGQTNGQADRP